MRWMRRALLGALMAAFLGSCGGISQERREAMDRRSESESRNRVLRERYELEKVRRKEREAAGSTWRKKAEAHEASIRDLRPELTAINRKIERVMLDKEKVLAQIPSAEKALALLQEDLDKHNPKLMGARVDRQKARVDSLKQTYLALHIHQRGLEVEAQRLAAMVD